jgi:hypothetical protein
MRMNLIHLDADVVLMTQASPNTNDVHFFKLPRTQLPSSCSSTQFGCPSSISANEQVSTSTATFILFFFSFVRRVPEFCLFLPSLRCPRDRDNNFDFIVFLEPPVLAISSYLLLMSIQHFLALLPRFCACSLSFFIKCKRRPCFFHSIDRMPEVPASLNWQWK